MVRRLDTLHGIITIQDSRIRMIRPAVKNDKFGVQRMEMLAIYFALVDNRLHFRRVSKRSEKKLQQQLIIDIRSDSKSTVEQLQGMSEIRDTMLRRICRAITKLLVGMTYYTILFNHLERTRNIAGLLLEQRRRKQKKQLSYLIELTIWPDTEEED